MNNMMVCNWKLFQQALIITTIVITYGEIIEPTKNDLLNHLLDKSRYDRKFPPTTENVTDVSVQIHITDLDSESDKDMEIGFTINLRMNWTDERLNFTENMTSYDVISLGDNVVDSLWIPDLYFTHEKKTELHGLFTKNQLVYIKKGGQILYSGRFNINSHCYMKFKKYPFDTQHCPIEIQSYAFTTDFVRLHWNGDNAVFIEPTIYTLSEPPKPPQERYHEYRYIYPETGEFSTLKTEIDFTRPEGGYGAKILAPPIIVSLIAISTILMKGGDFTARITIVSGGLTQVCVLWTGTVDLLSYDSTPDGINTWMLGNILVLAMIGLLHVFICMCQGDGNEDEIEILCRVKLVSTIVIAVMYLGFIFIYIFAIWKKN